VMKRKYAVALWQGSQQIAGTAAERYLAGRGLPELATSPALRFCPAAPHPGNRVHRLPALVGLVQDELGNPVAVHRTFITADGLKAPVEPVKASLGPFLGSAIRLNPFVADCPLVVGEGIESSASAGRLLRLPAWAAVTCGNLAQHLLLPPKVRHVIIASDPDDVGREAAWAAWHRWRDDGLIVQIATPDGSGDFNDLLTAGALRDG
jgi:putative DNA primase/helicase